MEERKAYDKILKCSKILLSVKLIKGKPIDANNINSRGRNF